MYRAVRCPCGECADWHVTNVANIQGVGFTERQARATAALLNFMETKTAEGLQELMNHLENDNGKDTD